MLLAAPTKQVSSLRSARHLGADVDVLDGGVPVEAGGVPVELVVAGEGAHRAAYVVADHVRGGGGRDGLVRVADPQPELLLPTALGLVGPLS